MKAITYYFGATEVQGRILLRRLEKHDEARAVTLAAIEKMHKRVSRFYGLNKKYRGDGSLRKEVE